MFVGGDDFHVGDDEVGRVVLSVGGGEAGNLAVLFGNFFDVGVEVDGDVEVGEEFLEAFGEVVHAVFDIPESVVELDDGHHVHVAWGVYGGGSDVFDEVFKNAPQVIALEVICDGAGH